MAIVVTNTPQNSLLDASGIWHRRGSLAITGLTAASGNTIPHGLPFVPKRISLRPSALGLWGETSVPDATNISVTVGTAGATSGTIDYEE